MSENAFYVSYALVTVPNSAGKHTFFRCCLVIADHNSYHIGELAIGRKVAGLWPKGRKD